MKHLRPRTRNKFFYSAVSIQQDLELIRERAILLEKEAQSKLTPRHDPLSTLEAPSVGVEPFENINCPLQNELNPFDQTNHE